MEKTTGSVIYEHRKSKGYTQKALADRLNVTDKAVSKWERDISRPDIDTIPKLAEILDIPIELLISPNSTQDAILPKPAVEEQANTPNRGSNNPLLLQYKESVHTLLRKGLLGFVIGFIFTLVVTLSDHEPFNAMYAVLIGLFLAGAPYGWELLTKIIGGWYVIGSIPIMIIAFMIKFVGSVLIGWFVYPIALLYNLIRAQEKGSKKKILFIVLFIAFICIIATFFIWQASI